MILKPLPLFSLLLSMISGILLGILVFQWYFSNHDSAVQTFAAALQQIDDNYVEDLDQQEMVSHAIRGMLTGLDEYSELLDQQSYEDLLSRSEGKFGGIGIEVSLSNDFFTVVSVIKNTPAERGGILAGDIIKGINGDPAKGMKMAVMIEQMKGAIGESVALLLERPGQEQRIPLVLQRELITTTSISHRNLDRGIGYIRLSSFDQNAGKNLKLSLAALSEKNPLTGLILDLRNNPGGILQSSVSVAEIFLDGGLVVSTQQQTTFAPDDSNNTSYFAAKGDDTDNLPVVVLINHGSASASEIVAGALQDRDRATIIGSTSFGKGTVQSLLPPLPDAQALKITTAYYYTPSGRSFHNSGIEPDINFSADEDELLAFASQHLLKEK
ncbi:S41 family peptidase [Pseudomonadales bacterium]|jgi:carboxyl-terminal processing protease|nr:S41 family peptidase [Pseudomonadales bacterium]MDB2594708.1 S41 family peptidase [Pseudomonadales bacterium]